MLLSVSVEYSISLSQLTNDRRSRLMTYDLQILQTKQQNIKTFPQTHHTFSTFQTAPLPPDITAFGKPWGFDHLWGHPGIGPCCTHACCFLHLSCQTKVCDLQCLVGQVVTINDLFQQDWERKGKKKKRAFWVLTVIYLCSLSQIILLNASKILTLV